MKKTFISILLIVSLLGFSVSANALNALPENKVAYVFQCDTCHEKIAGDTLPSSTSRKCYYEGCDGTVDYSNYTYCEKQYFYEFECGNMDCSVTKEFSELPEGTADAQYGVCSCGVTRTEDMFSISYKYIQRSRPCFYCFKVQVGTSSIYDSDICPYCSNTYMDSVDLSDSVDDNGILIYGGGGNHLYYCSQTDKFYEAVVDEDGDIIDDECPYCDNHSSYKVNILYCATCPSCGTRAERSHLDYFKKPFLAGTLNNAFMAIAVDITGTIDPNDFDITNHCYECGYDLSADSSVLITRHVDAPKGAVYEEHENDRDYKETDVYSENGSQYDTFFERIIWIFKKIFNFLSMLFSSMG